MDREKMIIHMIRDYYPNDTSGDEELKEAIAKGGYANIVRFFDLGYRKVPEGAVVLTKEELETTDKISQKIKEFYKWFIEIEKEQACKEKAMEIFEKIYEKEGYYPLASVGTSQNDMIEIAKLFGIKYTPYGVKVEE